jgi:methylthioribulose-1-phosphate dehydratase
VTRPHLAENAAMTFEIMARGLCALGRACHARGSVGATSGNFSAVTGRDPLRLAITPSGADKGSLAPEDILEIDAAGRVVRGEGRPSAEAALHLAVVRARGAGAVAHTHSLWATMLGDEPAVVFEGYEMLKALAGVETHAHREVLSVIDNTQDWPAAAPAVEALLRERRESHGFLIRRHGLYTWGRDLAEAGRHLEALEFLLEAEGRRRWRS